MRWPRAIASASSHSSFRTLLPPYGSPVRSSRLTQSSAMPASRPSAARRCTGVGSVASGRRGSRPASAGKRRSSAIANVVTARATAGGATMSPGHAGARLVSRHRHAVVLILPSAALYGADSRRTTLPRTEELPMSGPQTIDPRKARSDRRAGVRLSRRRGDLGDDLSRRSARPLSRARRRRRAA